MMKIPIAFMLAVSCIVLSGISSTVMAQDDQTMTMALTGDAIITRKLSVYKEPQFLQMIDLIRSADLAFVNLEMLFHDYETYPMHQSGGTYMRGDPSLANDLAWAGFDMVSMANNHTGDYGVEGMRLTVKYVEEAGLIHAGVGESLMEAREAKFLETANGRVALISCSSTFPDHSRAGRSRDDIPARPGLSPLRYDSWYEISRERMDDLVSVGTHLGITEDRDTPRERLRIFGNNFRVGDNPGRKTSPREEDLEEIASVVRNASELADYTIVTIHAHESDGDLSVPAQFLVAFARSMIDAGADIFVGHGPHVLRGIEFHNGKPILYSLGDFMFQNETLLRLPNENYERYGLGEHQHVADFNAARYDNDTRGFPTRQQVWESVIAVPRWEGKKLISLELHPITLGFGKHRVVRGRPMFAEGELSEKIIGDIRELSAAFGTTIEFKDGIGIVEIPR